MSANNANEQVFGYINGEFKFLNEIFVPALDRGFIYGDGCYEVIPVYNKKTFKLIEHIDRLFDNLNKIQIEMHENKGVIIDMLRQLINMTKLPYEYLYLQVTRGSYPRREHIFPKNPVPTIFAYSLPFIPPEFEKASQGMGAITEEDIRWKRCDIKSISLLGNVLLREVANKAQAEETILLKEGYLTEGSISNIFIVKSGVVMTPPLSNNILPGITRATAIQLIQDANIPFQERDISEQALREADEIWATSSTREVALISILDGKKLKGPFSLWEQVFKAYQKAKNT